MKKKVVGVILGLAGIVAFLIGGTMGFVAGAILVAASIKLLELDKIFTSKKQNTRPVEYADLDEELEKMKREEKEFDRLFDIWKMLREKFEKAQSAKNWQRVIETAGEIIEFDKVAKTIGICLPLFEAAIADAYWELSDCESALDHYHLALAGYIAENNKQPGSWEKDIYRLKKIIEELESS